MLRLASPTSREHENHLHIELRYCVWSISYTISFHKNSVFLLKLARDGFLIPNILTIILTRPYPKLVFNKDLLKHFSSKSL